MRITSLTPVYQKPTGHTDDKKFLNFLRGLPCCVCGKPPRSQAAHVRLGGRGGMGQKPLFSAVPLCATCHNIQHNQSHESIAKSDWWLDKADYCLDLWESEKK